MFLKTVTELEADFSDVRSTLLRDPGLWVAGLGAEAGEEGDRLVVQVGLDVAGHQVGAHALLEAGRPTISDRLGVLPVRLRSRDHRRLFPTMEGSLDVAWLGRDRTYLSLNLTYEPPLGLMGRLADRTLLHRVAETVVQRLLERRSSSRRGRGAGWNDGPSTSRRPIPRHASHHLASRRRAVRDLEDDRQADPSSQAVRVAERAPARALRGGVPGRVGSRLLGSREGPAAGAAGAAGPGHDPAGVHRQLG